MFPQFDDLTESRSSAIAQKLAGHGFADTETSARILIRLRELWLAVRRRSSQTQNTVDVDDSGRDWYWNLERVIREAPLRDTVLNVVDQFVRNASEHFDVFSLFGESPRSLDILSRLACGSPFLTQILLSDPLCLTTLTLHGRTSEIKSREQFVNAAMDLVEAQRSRSGKLSEVRRYQRRQLLRIGMCDAFGLLDLRFVTLQLSLLADAMVQCCLNIAAEELSMQDARLAVISLGKHGGEELNYSSDIDLVLIADRDSSEIQRLARLTIDGLADNIPPGFLYRVDLRLRPWGEAGPLVNTVNSCADYLIQDAALWEKQAMLKARVVAGDAAIGHQFLERIRPLLFSGTATQVRSSIQHMKERIEARLRQRGKLHSEVKLGIGSIRDVEFLVQSIQLIHGEREPRILSSNTLDSLVRLAEFGLISASWYRQLRAGYVFLRTIEHSLQLLHNQQTHELPADIRQLEWLANRLDYPDANTLMRRFDEHRQAVRAIFEECLQGVPLRDAVFFDDSNSVHSLTSSPNGSGGQTNDAADAAAASERLLASRRLWLNEVFSVLETGTSTAVACRPSDQDDSCELIVCGVDFSGWLSVVCGLLSIYRLDIRRGDALTGGGVNSFGDRCSAGRFLACFQVRLDPDVAPIELQSFVENLARTLQQEISRLGQLSRDGRIEEMRAELLSRFCDAVPRFTEQESMEADVNVELVRMPGSVLTQMNITGSDSWGFLYELASALSLSRFRVLRAIIDAKGNRVQDVLYVRERNGLPIESEERLQELQLAATLIKQFTHWLPSTNDPQHALSRFRELVERLQPASAWPDNMQSLRRGSVLHAVARVLGISQYLWETFLQSRHQELFPLLANAEELAVRECSQSLSLELDRVISLADDGSMAWTALNNFKDRHLFRIDMRHVLGHCRPFGAFSDELTELAELVVSKALELAWTQLVTEHGLPKCGDGITTCEWVVAGMGKFGGIEMGFASDIEMMLIYAESGWTEGANSISNATFFDKMVSAVSSGIRSAQDGIFHVDLRMRPFGQAGSAAVSLRDFEHYYADGGTAWPYERQAMVKFRCFAGSDVFGQVVTAACHRAIYSSGWFDFSAMRAMRERQVRQLVRGGSINAKLSEGGIVDCEYAVQALQLTFGGDMVTLRHPNTLHVLREASRLSLIDPQQREQIEGVYVFLRELIDCLRMVRGNARDLTIPPFDSRDWHQLAKRMKSIHDSSVPLESLEEQMQLVSDFSISVEQHCRKMGRHRPGLDAPQESPDK
jgi:glutamate-ammonia-ligase adenylyltransferase